jgi:MFS family permease
MPPSEKYPTDGFRGPDAEPVPPRGGRPGRLNGLRRTARVRAKQAVRRQVPGGARRSFRIDLTAMLLAGLYLGVIFPFVNVIARDDLGASSQVLALMAAAPFIGNLLALFFARAMEGRRKSPFVKWSHLTARSLLLLTFIPGGAWSFALIISSAQIIGTLATPAYAAIIKQIYPDSQRGRILSYTRAALAGAALVATMLSGWALAYIDFRYLFPLGGLVGVLAALVFSRIDPKEDVVPQDEQTGHSVFRHVRETATFTWGTLGILKEDSAYRWFALSVFTYGFGNLMTIPIIPLVQVDILSITKTQLAVMANVLQVVAIVSYFYWGRYVDRYSPQRAVVINVLLNALVPAVYMLTAAIPGANAWVLLPAFAISGVVAAGIDLSYFNALLTFAGPDNVSRYQALQSFLLGIRGTIAPFAGSFLATVLKANGQDLRWAFMAGVVLMLVGAWMQFVAMRRQEARRRIQDIG